MPSDGARPWIRRGWLLVAATAVAAGGIAVQRWGMPGRPAGPAPAVARPLDDATGLSLRPVPVRTVDRTASRVPRPHPRKGTFLGAAGGSGSPSSSAGDVGAGRQRLRPLTGLHLTAPRKWPQRTYEIRAHPKPPLRFLCDVCPIVNAALHSPPGGPSPAEKITVNAATFGAMTLLGSGKIDLVEWDPP
ncbi:MAG TPA: hypothetical protein VJT32_16455 [bacterium]|nr:hypothetical protein [bacterium]